MANNKPPPEFNNANGLLPIWKEVTEVLERLHGIEVTDIELIKTYCYHANMVRKTTAILAEKPFLFDAKNNPYPNPLNKDLQLHSKLLRLCADSLGISVKARKQWKRADKNAHGKKHGADFDKLMQFALGGKKK